MTFENSASRPAEVRPIVTILLRQMAKLRAEGGLNQSAFEAQLERLVSEELRPRGQTMLMRYLRDGHTRFIIKDRAGAVCEMIDCEDGDSGVG